MSPIDTDETTIEMKRRAWTLAHKLISLARVAPQREGTAMLEVTTQALCDAMGTPGGARLEAVQAFARDVVGFMSGYGVYVSCGCGYLSLRVTGQETAKAFLEGRLEPTSFRPQDLEAYFVEHVLKPGARTVTLDETCDAREIRDGMREV